LVGAGVGLELVRYFALSFLREGFIFFGWGFDLCARARGGSEEKKKKRREIDERKRNKPA
jgi:hypothetical protein